MMDPDPARERARSSLAPSVLLTFLIADVRGYTQFTNEQGVPAAARLADRFAVLCRLIVSQHSGEVVELRGDEALAVFSSPRSALLAAVELQGRFREELAADPTLPLRVGMGIDTGEVVPIQGGYRGRALNLAARLCSLAGHGEVFSSAEVVQQAERIEGLAYIERGRVQLKGFPEPIRVIHVLPQEDLPEHFPPLVSLVAKPSNLPLQLTPFIGREREVGEVVDLLRHREVRLLTLTGPGGTGKTRLALQVGGALLDEFERGVFFVNLASVADPSLIASTIARTLKVKEIPGQDILDTVIEYLRDKQMLLVLDNFEHLLEGVSDVSALLAACPNLTILVTSRAVLRLSAEYEYGVPPLSIPDATHLPNLETLTQYDAVALFIERARAVRPNFAVTNENAPAVAEICHRLDGLPLAIELAAARVKLFPPQALLQRLSSRLKFLTGGARDRPTRQQTLRDTLDWSYSLLSADEQALFARLSVFAGGCTFEAAEAVCNLDGELDILEGMTSLVDKSLLRQDSSRVPAPAGDPRFLMLETIREYAAEKLTERGEVEELERAHGEYFLTLAEEAEPALSGPNQVLWLDRLDTEHDNLRAALTWTRDHGEGAIMLRMAAALFPFWHPRCYYTDARRWLRDGLAAGGTEPTPARAKALYGLCWMEEDGEPLMQESLAVFRALGDRQGMAQALTILGNFVTNGGDYERGEPLYQEALQLAREAGDTLGMTRPVLNLGNIAMHQGDLDRAERLFGESLALAREVGERRAMAVAIANTGIVARYCGDLERAERLLQEGFALYSEMGDTWNMAWVRVAHADVVLEQGDAERARRMCEESLRAVRDTRDANLLLPACESLAIIAAVQREAARGVRLAAAAASFRGEDWPMHPDERPRYERHLAALRAQLDESSWNTAWSEGAAMTLEEAASYALGETE